MTESRPVIDDQGELIERIREDHKSFLATLTRNADGSVTGQRTGYIRLCLAELGIRSPHLLLDKPPRGVPHSDCEYVEKILREMGYQLGDQVVYSITIAPKVPEK